MEVARRGRGLLFSLKKGKGKSGRCCPIVKTANRNVETFHHGTFCRPGTSLAGREGEEKRKKFRERTWLFNTATTEVK